jgi:hypothetical protein
MARATCTRSTSLQHKPLTSPRPLTRSSPTSNATPCRDLSSGGTSNEREQVPTNRLTVYQDLRFQYDLHGNIVERRIGWHTV